MVTEPHHGARRATASDIGLAIPWVLGAFWLVTDHRTRGLALLFTALVVTAVRLKVGPDRFTKGLRRLGDACERGLARVASTLLWGLVVGPAWAWRRALGRRPGQGRWVLAEGTTSAQRTYGRPPRSAPATVRSRVVSSIGLVVILLTVNLLAGLAWERIAGTDETTDPRAHSAALRDEPWARTHLAELKEIPSGYWPYLLTATGDYEGETISLSDGVRRSYTPAGDGDRPVVMFLGGSTMFGEGQRDEHTIASEVARLAEADGVPITAVNLGQRSFVSWQDMLLFEQRSTVDPPDIAVFYDGGNDVTTQFQTATAGFPTHYAADAVARRLTGRPIDERTAPQGTTAWEDALAAYSSHSAVHKLARFLTGSSRQPAAPPVPPGERRDEAAQVGRDAAELYQRARALSLDVARERGIVPVFYWQPTRDHTADQAYQVATATVGAPTIDISDALDDHPEVYLDPVHTNELGARLVAERMWEDLEPLVRAADR